MQGQGVILHISDVIASQDFIKKESQVKQELTEDATHSDANPNNISQDFQNVWNPHYAEHGVFPQYPPNPLLYSQQNAFSEYIQNHHMYEEQNYQNQFVDFNGDYNHSERISQSENTLITINNNAKNNHQNSAPTFEKTSPQMRRKYTMAKGRGRSKSEWMTDDETLPENWKKRSYQVNHNGTKSGKATLFEYLSPNNIIFASRSKVVLHLKQDGRYSQEEINKVLKGRISYGNNQKNTTKEDDNSQKIVTNEHSNNQKVIINEHDNDQMRTVANEYQNGIPNLLNSTNYSTVMNNSNNMHDISNMYNSTDLLKNVSESVPGNNPLTFFNDAYNANISNDSGANFSQYSNDEHSEQIFINNSYHGISNYDVANLSNTSNSSTDSTAFLSQYSLSQSLPDRESQSQQLFLNSFDGSPHLINQSSYSNNSNTNITQDNTSQFVLKTSKQSKLTLSNHENRSRFSEWETDNFLPSGWKKRFSENKNRNMKNGKAIKYQYLTPMQEIITSRAEVIEYMIRSGIYSEGDILKVKKGRAKNVRKSPLETVDDKRLEMYDSVENESSTELTDEYQRSGSNFENYENGNGHENLLEKLNKITYTKFQESSPTASHFPNNQIYTDEENKSNNPSENLSDREPLIYNNGFKTDDDLMSGYDAFASFETVMNNSKHSVINNEKAVLMKPAQKRAKRKRIERTEWELEESLPYGWKKRSFENIWNKNGEKLIFKKYEYLSPSGKIFSTRISVIAHMQELPSIYSEEHILIFKQSYGIRSKSSNSGNLVHPSQGVGNTNSQWMEELKNNVTHTEAVSHEYNNFEYNTKDANIAYDNFKEQNQDINNVLIKSENTMYGEISYPYDNMKGDYEIKESTSNDVHTKIPRLNYNLEYDAEYCKVNDTDIPNNIYSGFKEQNQDLKCDNIELEKNFCFKNEGDLVSEESIIDVINTETHSLNDCQVNDTDIPFNKYDNLKEQNQDLNDVVSNTGVGENSYPYENMEGDFRIKEFSSDDVHTTMPRLNYTLEYDSEGCKVNDIAHDRYGNLKGQSQDINCELSNSDNNKLEKKACYKKEDGLESEEFITDVNTEIQSLNNSEDCKVNGNDILYNKYGQNHDINDVASKYDDNLQLEEFSNSFENHEYTINSKLNNNCIKTKDNYMDIDNSFNHRIVNGSEELMEDSINDYNYGMVWCNFMQNTERFDEFSDDNMKNSQKLDQINIYNTEKSHKNYETNFKTFQELDNINRNNNSCKNATERALENYSDSLINNTHSDNSYEDSIIANDSIVDADQDELNELIDSSDKIGKSFSTSDEFSISEVSNISFDDAMESLEANRNHYTNDSVNHLEDKLSNISQIYSDHSFNSNLNVDSSKLFDEYGPDNLNRSNNISDDNSEMPSSVNREDLETSFGSFSDNHELSNDDDTDNSKLSPNHYHDNFEMSSDYNHDLPESFHDSHSDNFKMSYDVDTEKSPNLAYNLKLSIDHAEESIIDLNIPANANILKNSDASDDNNGLTIGNPDEFEPNTSDINNGPLIANPDEFDPNPSFLGPAITTKIGDFSILTVLFTNNPHPSKLEIDDISEDLEMPHKDIKWAFIKLREKFQIKRGQTVDSKPVKELLHFFQSKYGQNSFVF